MLSRLPGVLMKRLKRSRPVRHCLLLTLSDSHLLLQNSVASAHCSRRLSSDWSHDNGTAFPPAHSSTLVKSLSVPGRVLIAGGRIWWTTYLFFFSSFSTSHLLSTFVYCTPLLKAATKHRWLFLGCVLLLCRNFLWYLSDICSDSLIWVYFTIFKNNPGYK